MPNNHDISSQLRQSAEMAADALRQQLEQLSKQSADLATLTALSDAMLRPLTEFQLQTEAVVAAAAIDVRKLAFPELKLPNWDFSSVLAPLFQSFDEISRQLKQWSDAMPERARHDLPVLASRGWYLDPELAARAPSDMAKDIESGDAQSVDEILIEHFRERASEIKDVLIAKYPNRMRFLSKAFDAHERRDFELSIPVFLAQADGICSDRTSKLLFQRDNKRPQIAGYVATAITDAYEAALLSPLTQNHAISLTKGERPGDFQGLNRHQVLHGESLNYDTEINSLKAISLLNYLSWVLHFGEKAA
jgi:hypothetical protein